MEWLAGNRLRGTTAERPSASLQSPSVGGWVEVGRTTLGSSGSIITVDSLPDKRYYMILGDHSSAGTSIRLNGDTGTSYAVRRSTNGGSDSTNTNRSSGGFITDVRSFPHFNVTYLSNLSSKEKLWQNQNVHQSTAGAGTAPNREEGVGKWTNTSNAVDEFAYLAWTGSYSSGDECVVLGWDPDDTHTTNFWEELASVDLSGGEANDIDSGVFTSKKYLWIQAFCEYGSGVHINPYFRVGNGTIDTGNNYATRWGGNGSADSTVINNNKMVYNYAGGGAAVNSFANIFIINIAGQEKLAISNTIDAEGAGNAPSREEDVGKWTNTSNQINRVNFTAGTGDFGTNTILKVWGSD